MPTTDILELNDDEFNKFTEELGRQIAEIRKNTGISHFELAKLLEVPVCFTEILENGLWISEDGRRLTRWKSNPFTQEELAAISDRISNGISIKPHTSEPETVFFYPITISDTAIFDEIHSIANQKDFTTLRMHQSACELGLRFRIFYNQQCIQNGKENADILRRRLVSVIQSYVSCS